MDYFQNKRMFVFPPFVFSFEHNGLKYAWEIEELNVKEKWIKFLKDNLVKNENE